MKLMFLSDIHGSVFYAKQALEIFEKEEADYLIVLGDILYHGPRNPLPKDYDPKEVSQLLNEYSEKIIAVRGNCDSEVDQMMLDFPIMSDYSTVFYNEKRIFVTHGHIYNKTNIPKISKGDVFISGHTHIPVAEERDEIFMLNPGSITLPKQNNPNSYAVLERDCFEIKDLDMTTFKTITLH